MYIYFVSRKMFDRKHTRNFQSNADKQKKSVEKNSNKISRRLRFDLLLDIDHFRS